MIITIDGPAGSGKSTVARKLANELGILHINQGALFRAMGLEAVARGLDLSDDRTVSALAKSLTFAFANGQLTVNGRVLAEELQTSEAGRLASVVAMLPNLRNVLLTAQHELTRRSSAVVEGRDAGSVGFPGAELKLYLDARLEVRAARRFAELAGHELAGPEFSGKGLAGRGGENSGLEELTKQIAERDLRDSSRTLDPLCQAADAVLIDTSDLAPDEVVANILALVKSKMTA